MDLGFTNATAVVGGGRGMDLAAERCLAEDGARVAIVGRSRHFWHGGANSFMTGDNINVDGGSDFIEFT